jgi:hypothetical protein
MAGLVLGFDPWKMGMQIHQVDVNPLLDKIGIDYKPEDKYKGANGEDIGKPENPTVLKCY